MGFEWAFSGDLFFEFFTPFVREGAGSVEIESFYAEHRNREFDPFTVFQIVCVEYSILSRLWVHVEEFFSVVLNSAGFFGEQTSHFRLIKNQTVEFERGRSGKGLRFAADEMFGEEDVGEFGAGEF